VNVIKQTTSPVFAGVDSGFNHLIRPMLYGSQHQSISQTLKEKNAFIQLWDTYAKRTFAIEELKK
jgi:diaminopimelate decarboxylase